jgi:hypothetical protein
MLVVSFKRWEQALAGDPQRQGYAIFIAWHVRGCAAHGRVRRLRSRGDVLLGNL